jgi:hypothetical protein
MSEGVGGWKLGPQPQLGTPTEVLCYCTPFRGIRSHHIYILNKYHCIDAKYSIHSDFILFAFKFVFNLMMAL